MDVLLWSATCVVRRDGTLGPESTGPSDVTETKETPAMAEVRTIQLPDRTCILIVEAQGTDALPGADVRSRFLQSFRQLGAPNW